jgi:hypothetical protein
MIMNDITRFKIVKQRVIDEVPNSNRKVQISASADLRCSQPAAYPGRTNGKSSQDPCPVFPENERREEESDWIGER